MKLKNNTNGFTMIELLIVVVIIGIFALITMPKYADIIHQNNLNKAKGEMYALKSAISSYFTISDQWPPGSECTDTTGPGINTFEKWEYILIIGSGPGAGATSSILSSSHNWRGPYIERIPLDPWDNPYIFRVYGSATDALNTYRTAIVCTGPTGVLIDCTAPHAEDAFTSTMKTTNHPPNKDGLSFVYSPGASTTPNTTEYNIYLWLE